MTASSGHSSWRPVIGMAAAVGLVYLSIFSVPPLITTFVDDLGFTHAETGAMMSVCLAAFLVGSLVSGRAAERFGAVRLIVASLVLCGVATACFAITASLGPMLVCRALVGLAGGLIYAPGVTLVTTLLPPAKANLGVGIFLCGLSVGGTIAYFATRLVSEGLDWRWPSWIFGAVILAGAAVVAALAAPAATAGRKERHEATVDVRAMFSVAPFRVLVPTLFLALFTAYGVFTWIPPYLDESAGFSTSQISLTSALMTLAGIPATFGVGWLAYRTGRPLAIAAAGLAMPALLVVFALTSTPSPGGATVVSFLASFGVSGGLAPLYALPPILFGAVAGATASGVAAAAAMAGAVTSTYLGGWLIGATGYDAAFWMYTIGAIVTALCLVPLIARAMRAPQPQAATVAGSSRAG
jgi:predicted MFS family arabinose efflux permease